MRKTKEGFYRERGVSVEWVRRHRERWVER